MDGILVYQQIHQLIASGAVLSNPAIAAAQVQPSSLDLRLATRGYRVRSGFLPENVRVAERLEEVTLYTFDLTDGAVLERGHCYVIPLLERIEKPLPYEIRANPKSSTGRLDLFTRLLADKNGRFEQVRAGARAGPRRPDQRWPARGPAARGAGTAVRHRRPAAPRPAGDLRPPGRRDLAAPRRRRGW